MTKNEYKRKRIFARYFLFEMMEQIHSGMERYLVEEIVDPQAQSFGPIGAGNIVSRKNQKDTHVCETFHLVRLTIWANIVYSSPSTKVSMIQALR